MEYRTAGNMEKKLNRACTDTPANSLKGITLESTSAICVGRLVLRRISHGGMWRISTFQEVTSTIATNVMRSLTPKQSGATIALANTPASGRSDCQHG